MVFLLSYLYLFIYLFFKWTIGSVLPEDDWFAEIAQIAIKMLSGKATFGDDEEDVISPTASV